MSNDKEILADEAVLLAFSVEPDHSPATLQRYLSKYPHLTGDLLDLSLDIELSGLEDAPRDGDFNTPELDHSWETFNLKLTEDNRSALMHFRYRSKPGRMRGAFPSERVLPIFTI
jgi:hypothetical protein